jgi:Toprim-like
MMLCVTTRTTTSDHDVGRYDRSEILRRVDLAALLERLGAKRGLRSAGRRFPCPSTAHEQTGRTPPATVDAVAAGYGVWHCHACGAGGTAIDAVLAAGEARDVGEALSQLREERGAAVRANRRRRHGHRRSPSAPRDRSPGKVAEARRHLARYVEACHGRLLRAEAASARAWLYDRGLTDEEIAAHRIGYDPGYATLSRAYRTVPAPAGPAITLPLLDESAAVVYAQARVLEDGRAASKYLNPHREWIGPSPRVGMVHTPANADHGVVLVCEGILDAILAARHFATRAMIGAKQPDEAVAERLVAVAAGRPLIACLDSDAEGQRGAERLIALVRSRSTAHAGSVALDVKDITELWRRGPDVFGDVLRSLVAQATRVHERRARAHPARRRSAEGSARA